MYQNANSDNAPMDGKIVVQMNHGYLKGELNEILNIFLKSVFFEVSFNNSLGLCSKLFSLLSIKAASNSMSAGSCNRFSDHGTSSGGGEIIICYNPK